jgi:hypothetical protein
LREEEKENAKRRIGLAIAPLAVKVKKQWLHTLSIF